MPASPTARETSIPSAASSREPCRSAIHAGERRSDEHPDRHRRELEPGHDRRLSLRSLEVEDEQEHQREAGETVQERGHRRGREEPVAGRAKGRASASGRDVRSTTKSGRRTTAAPSPPITSQLLQPVSPPFESASTSPVRPMTNVVTPSRSRPRSSLRPGRSSSTRKPQMQPIRPNGTLNQKTHCHDDVDERAAEHRSDHEPDRGDHRVRAHREAELSLREGVGDERGGVREEEGAADALQDAPEDQLGAAAREARAERGRARRPRSRARTRACGRRGPTAVRP